MSTRAATFIEQNLMPGERLIASTRKHPAPVVLTAGLLAISCVLLLLGVIIGQKGLPLIIIAGPMSLFLILVVITLTIQWGTTELGLTNQRIVIKSGWMPTSVREMPLGKVEAIRVEQGVVGKLFLYGSLVVSGTGGTRRKFADIMNPFEFYKRVQEQVVIAQKTA